jgi:hypothetical protein
MEASKRVIKNKISLTGKFIAVENFLKKPSVEFPSKEAEVDFYEEQMKNAERLEVAFVGSDVTLVKPGDVITIHPKYMGKGVVLSDEVLKSYIIYTEFDILGIWN